MPCLCAAPSRLAAQETQHSLAAAISLSSEGDCLTREALLESIQAWLRRDTLEAELSLVVDATAPGASIVVLERGEVRATRRFDALPASCADQRAVLGLAIAIAIDAALVERLVTTPQVPRAPVAAPPTPASLDPVESPPTPASPVAPELAEQAPALVVELGVEGGLALGVLPDASARAAVSGSLLLDGSLRFTLGAFVTSPSTQVLGSGQVRALLAGGRLDACVVRADRIVDVAGCIGVALGSLMAEGQGFAESYAVAMPYVAPMARLELTAWLDSLLGLHLAVDALYQLADLRLRVLDSSGASRAEAVLPSAGVVIAAGLRVRL